MKRRWIKRLFLIVVLVFVSSVFFELLFFCPVDDAVRDAARLAMLKMDVRNIEGRRLEKRELAGKVLALKLDFVTTRYEPFIDYRDAEHWTVKLVPTKRRGYGALWLTHVYFPDIVIHGPQGSPRNAGESASGSD